MFGITSEPQSLATEAEEDWDCGFPAVGDPHHEILDACRERGLIEIFFNENFGHLRNRPWASHPKGYYQPGVLALAKTGRVLYRWRCRPNRSNMSGAGARPSAAYTWNEIQSRLAGGEEPALDETPQFGAKDLSWFHFMLILVAHGWFLRPKAMPLGRRGDPAVSPGKMPRKMLRRVYGFVAAWLAALLLIPVQLVALAFVTWGLILLPGLIEIHRQFQNEPAENADKVTDELKSP